MFNNSKTKSEYLDSVLKSYSMSHISELERAHRTKGAEIKEALRRHYGLYNPYNPMNSGSIAKATAINTKFDLDIIVPFPYKKFGRLEDMAKDMLRYFKNDYAKETNDPNRLYIRDQSWSVGLEFSTSLWYSPKINIDIVPGRELRKGAYASNYFLNLKNTKDGSWMQTNIHKQIETIRNSHDSVRKVVRLLKVWKYARGYKGLKSFLIELAAIRAFAEYPGSAPKGLWEQVKMVLEYISKNFLNPHFRLIDPGNAGNNVMDTLSSFERSGIAHTLTQLIKQVEGNDAYLRQYFPIKR